MSCDFLVLCQERFIPCVPAAGSAVLVEPLCCSREQRAVSVGYPALRTVTLGTVTPGTTLHSEWLAALARYSSLKILLQQHDFP